MSTPLPALYQCVVCREPATLNVLGIPGGSRWYCAAHAPPELSFVSKDSLDAALAETASLKGEVCDAMKEAARLRAAIRKHRDQRGDGRCWLDDADLYGAIASLPTEVDTRLPCRDEFLESCRRFYQQRRAPHDMEPAPSEMTIAQLEAEIARLEAPPPPSRLAVTVDDPHGDITSISLLSESRDAVVYLIELARKRAEVYLIELARKRAEVGMWSCESADSATAYLEGEEVPLATITFTGLDLGENPLCRAQTVRYGCVVTIARNKAGGHERSLYTRPK